MPQPEELESTCGYPYTHFDCPHCGNAMEAEGDVSGEIFECDDCHEKFTIRH